MNKTEALARLDALEVQAAKLRDVINTPDPKSRLIYNGQRLYVAKINDKPYILAGREDDDHFMWFCFSDRWPTEQAWAGNHKTGQAALDYVQDEYIVREFTNAREGMDYFYELYCKAHK